MGWARRGGGPPPPPPPPTPGRGAPPRAPLSSERGFGKDAVDEPGIAGVFRRPGKGLLHLFVIYEFFGMQGMGIIHGKPLAQGDAASRRRAECLEGRVCTVMNGITAVRRGHHMMQGDAGRAGIP